ncbi:MAG: LamG-like jellyroll fold domain-containing protein, partial [Candidatus Hinthialibacter sp.]
IEMERNGKVISFYMLNQAGDRVSMGSVTLEDLEDPVYAGLAVTAHENGSLSDLYFINTEIDLMDLAGIRVVSFTGDGQPTFEDFLNVAVNVFTRQAGAISVVETPPAGWVVTNIQASAGSAALNADGDIEWTVEDQLGELQLTYDLIIPTSTTEPVIVGQFSGVLNNAEIPGQTDIKISGLLPQEILDQQDITSGLIAHWTFDEGEGTVAADSSGQGRNAEIWAGDPQWVDGVLGTALEFDGDDGLYVPGWYGIAGAAPRTIMCWIKSTATNTHGILSWGLSSGNGRKEHFRINNSASNGVVGAIRTEIQGTFNVGSTIVNDGEWHLIASVLPAGGQYVVDFHHYVDGLLDERSGTNNNGTVILIDTAAEEGVSDQEFRLAMSVQGGEDRYFPGIIDEVRVYDRGLTNAEIQAIYVLERGDSTSVSNFMLY